MFAKLTGLLDYIDEDSCIVDVSGVGYLVFIPSHYFNLLSAKKEISLYIQTIVKEDSISLYGFLEEEQKKLFNLLILVQGVGPRIALMILSKISFDDLQKAIVLQDVETLKTIPGIGIKVAQRIVNELKDKITKIFNITDKLIMSENFKIKNTNQLNDAMVALEGLGYSKFEIQKIMSALVGVIDENTSVEDIIKYALQHISKGL